VLGIEVLDPARCRTATRRRRDPAGHRSRRDPRVHHRRAAAERLREGRGGHRAEVARTLRRCDAPLPLPAHQTGTGSPNVVRFVANRPTWSACRSMERLREEHGPGDSIRTKWDNWAHDNTVARGPMTVVGLFFRTRVVLSSSSSWSSGSSRCTSSCRLPGTGGCCVREHGAAGKALRPSGRRGGDTCPAILLVLSLLLFTVAMAGPTHDVRIPAQPSGGDAGHRRVAIHAGHGRVPKPASPRRRRPPSSSPTS
jgi:hypothetical protein